MSFICVKEAFDGDVSNTKVFRTQDSWGIGILKEKVS